MSRSPLRRILLASVVCLAGLAGTGVPAASAAVPDRIVTAVSSAGRVEIANSVHPKALLAADLGPAAADTKLDMSIRFNLSDAQEAALDQLLADQQNPASPQFHQWLTPAQYGAQFGLSSADVAKVTAWLAGQGFTVTGVAPSSNMVSFEGTIGQAQAAFSTSIHNLSLNGETHFANVTNVQVPRAFGGVVMAVTGLHDFRFKPRLHTSVVRPDFTSSISGNHYIAPGDLYTIYNSNPLLNAGTTGVGETVAVTGQVDINTADVVAFRSASGLSTTNLPTTVHEGCDPGTAAAPITACVGNFPPNQSDLAESSIDVEWSGAMAPSATILFVNGADIFNNAMTGAIMSDLAPIVTTSYGACEAGWGSTELISMNALFKQGNAQGQTILAAAGDEGAADCDAQGVTAASEGLAVDYPGSSPYVTSMGGTMFNEGIATVATSYWSGTNGTTGGSALSYIPELPWNDSIYGFSSTGSDFGGGGGGASAFFTKPTWQVGTPADGARDVPDLALNASDAHDSLLYCVNVALGDSCTTGYRLANNDLNVAGGTSFDSQIFGGMLALVEQKIASKLGNTNPILYALANNSTYYTPGAVSTTSNGLVFNDVTSGSNAMVCTAGTQNCPNGGTEGFMAGNGYDLASGWGSVNLSNLANAWAWGAAHPLGVGSLGSNASATTLSASSGQNGSVTATTTVILTATVSGTAATPTGTVQFLTNNAAIGTPVTLVSSGVGTATATYSWVTSCSNFGQNALAASYSGDGNYLGSKGPALTAGGASQTSSGSFLTSAFQVQVTGSSCADFSIATPSTVTVAAGGTIPPATVTVTPANGFVGTVNFSVVTTSTTDYSPTFTISPGSVTINSASAATTSVALSGITASLHRPGVPGEAGPGTMLARQTPAQAPHAGRTWYAAAGSGAALASLLLWTLPRRRRLGGLLLVTLAFALIGGATGCGSSQPGPPTGTGTGTGTTPSGYAGDYYVTVVGTYTNSTTGQIDVHSTTVTYVIN